MLVCSVYYQDYYTFSHDKKLSYLSSLLLEITSLTFLVKWDVLSDRFVHHAMAQFFSLQAHSRNRKPPFDIKSRGINIYKYKFLNYTFLFLKLIDKYERMLNALSKNQSPEKEGKGMGGLVAGGVYRPHRP